MTRIMCGFVPGHLMSVTSASILAFAPCTEYIDMSGSVYNYWQAMTNRWSGTQTLITIEQDIEITEETVNSFENCLEPWCTYEYPVYETENTHFSLGCAKFTAEAQRMVTIPRVAYGILDTFIYHEFRQIGIEPHVHGSVAHHHDYSGVDRTPGFLDMHRKQCRSFKERLDMGLPVFGENAAHPSIPSVQIRDEDGSWIDYEPDKHDWLIPHLNETRQTEK